MFESFDEVSDAPPGRAYAGPLEPEWDDVAYTARFTQVKAYIAAGDIYQANFTQRWTANRDRGLDSFALYRRLRSLSPAPYAAIEALSAIPFAGRTVFDLRSVDDLADVAHALRYTRKLAARAFAARSKARLPVSIVTSIKALEKTMQKVCEGMLDGEGPEALAEGTARRRALERIRARVRLDTRDDDLGLAVRGAAATGGTAAQYHAGCSDPRDSQDDGPSW